MELGGRALYNLLRIHWLEDPQLKVKPWQVEDYRALSIEQLLDRLSALGVVIDKAGFVAYTEACDSPEALTDVFWVSEEQGDQRDRLYLVIFELWRRLVPHQLSLSIFCDELDQLIEAYDQGELDKEKSLQDMLKRLEDLLDSAMDQSGEKAIEIFKSVSQYFAHDLQGFLYDYISDQIEQDNGVYASECLSAFYDYIPEKKWFDLLRAWLFAKEDVEALNLVVARLLEDLEEETDEELFLEMAKFLVHRGHVRLFVESMRRALQLIQVEEKLQRALKLMEDYYRCLDRDEEVQRVQAWRLSREDLDPDEPLLPEDRATAEKLIRAT